MEKSNDEEKKQLNLQLELKNLAELPENIKFFPANSGTLCVAVDQAGKAIALAYVPSK